MGPEPSPLDQSSTFLKWALSLPRLILACRTKLSWFLARSFSATWQSPSLPTATFPLPVPHPGCFAGGSSGLSRTRLVKLARQRLLHVTVFCLNYVFLGRPPNPEEIGRSPNRWQLTCFQHLRALLVACGDLDQDYKFAPGRSGPELGAALFQLEQFASSNVDSLDHYKPHRPLDFKDDPDLIDLDLHPELRPYKNLDASRLKIVGEGSWPMKDYIDGPLWLPFVEPKFLMHFEDVSHLPVPNLVHESREENLKLCKVWDSRGLLALFRGPVLPGHFSKVFNCFKNADVDRQIGDRRIVNAKERSLDGPSSCLPPGFMLTSLRTKPFVEKVCASITDRQDYYHQTKVSPERARTNMLPFLFTDKELEGCAALSVATGLESAARRAKKRREDVGDGFGAVHDHASQRDGWYGCFNSLFQGDHLGVEFALQGHECLLQANGMLDSSKRLLGHHPFPLSTELEGLIIDDYFAIGIEAASTPSCNTFAARALAQAREIYASAQLPGSPEKDVEAECVFKAAGAEIVSDTRAVALGKVLIGAPLTKRLGISSLSLRAARLPSTSSRLISRLGGNWTSILLYRRSLAAVVDDLFRLAAEAERFSENAVIFQPMTVRNELIVLASLAPIISTNAAVNYCPWLLASDASLAKGAFTFTPASEKVVEVLWLGSDKKGCYSKLEGFPKDSLAALGEELYEDVRPFDFQHEKPKKSLLLYYDFVEFFGGSGRVSKMAYDLGLVVAPPLDLDASSHYNLEEPRLIEWAFHMIEEGRFKSFLTEPPCTTFSAAAYPALRSYDQPEGYDPSERRTKHGNLLSNRSFLLLRHGRKHRRPCGKEQPRLSKMAWRKAWRQMLRLGFQESVIASCQYGSIHKKEFRFLTFMLDAEGLDTRCPGGHDHVKIEGSYTSASAVYTWDLARHLALHFQKALRRQQLADEDSFQVEGHESLVVNDALISRQWSLGKVWSWKAKQHINVLEIRSALEVVKEVGRGAVSQRAVGLLDSRVAKGALAKGRSTSIGLQATCKKVAAFEIATLRRLDSTTLMTLLVTQRSELPVDFPSSKRLHLRCCNFGIPGASQRLLQTG